MSRSLGTALGVALVTFPLHVLPAGARLPDEPQVVLTVLAVAAVRMLLCALRIPATRATTHVPAARSRR